MWMLAQLCTLLPLASAFSTPRAPAKITRPTRLPVWPAWQGLPLVLLSQLPGPCRGWADQLEATFGGRVAPMQFAPQEADPFILLVHHRHAFRPFDFLRPLFSAVIMPEGFPAHPHRGFETVTYVLPGRAGLTHRDSEGTKMRYGDGAVQWMTAGRGMLHEEMWDIDAGSDAELYQLWVNLPPAAKFAEPRVTVLLPEQDGSGGKAVEVQREGNTPVRRGRVLDETRAQGAVRVRTLADSSRPHCDEQNAAGCAETYSPMVIEHVELHSEGATYTLPLPEGWTCLVYVRKGAVGFGGAGGGDANANAGGAVPGIASMHELAYMARGGGDCLTLTNAAKGSLTDVLVLAGQPIGAPVIASGTMVMNSDREVQEALQDYRRGEFGVPWDHQLDDEAWAAMCDQRAAMRSAVGQAERRPRDSGFDRIL